jgi:hypothetical protein
MVVIPLINSPEHDLGTPTIGELAVLLAHDLRTPLNAVRGFSELLLSGTAGPMTGEMVEFIGEIGRAGRVLEEAVLCVQALSETCIIAPEFTCCELDTLILDAGFAIRPIDWPDAVTVIGEAGHWWRLLRLCRDHLTDGMNDAHLSAKWVPVGDGQCQLVLSTDEGSGVTLPSELRERLMRRLAASQHARLVSEAPHRPIRLLACCPSA